MARDLCRARELAWRLAVRDVRSQYRGSLLGILWVFVTPLTSAATWLFLNATGIVRVADTGIPYAAYVFTGTMLWQTFTEALTSPLAQINASKAMLAKLNFPREALLLSGLLKLCYNAAIKLFVMLPVLAVLGVWPDLHLALFPIALLVIILVGFTLGLLVAPLGMLYTDVGRAIPVLTQIGMYTSPVVFAMPKSGLIATVFQLNFMTPVLVTARAWLTGFATPVLSYFIGVSLVALIFLLLAWFVFHITMPVIIERMNS